MKILCIGRNYAKHAAELGNEVPTEPVFFGKPDSSLLRPNQPLFYPEFTSDLHYECELVVRIKKVGKHIQEKFAYKYYDEIALGIDFTARDIQSACKKQGLPWEKAKAFDGSAALGSFVHKDTLEEPYGFRLEKNGEEVQVGSSSDMIFSIDRLISYLSKFYTFKIGDLIFTGTPEGVGPVQIGDELVAFLAGDENLRLRIK
ncbi:fumarylacetoacetate hydrolase family protein [Cryomorphaceae bacterium]|nr:fumarylacetoacetate hydrolase family protein [Cryomorphaceae bacterium]